MTVPVTSTTYRCPLCSRTSQPDVLQLGGYTLYLCTSCSLRFAPEAFEVAVDYDAVYQSAEYQTDQVRALHSMDGKELANQGTYRAFFEQVPRAPGARLLDVGCGVGRFCVGAYSRGWDVTGIDVSPLAISIAKEFAPFPLRVATVEELISQGEHFDVVTAFEVLEHLRSPLQFLSNIQKIVRPGGQTFFTVPNWDCAGVQSTTRPDWLPPIHLMYFTELALRRAGELSGLERVSTGVIWSDTQPRGGLAKARWAARRVLQRPRDPLGLWLHGWVSR